MTKLVRCLALAAGVAVGCSDTSDDGDTGAAGSSAAATLAAPVLGAATPMVGALHVTWTNKQADCDAIEGERRTDAAPYAVVFSVPGEADNKHDTGATENTTYTYRLRCKKGAAYSSYSNELSASPVK